MKTMILTAVTALALTALPVGSRAAEVERGTPATFAVSDAAPAVTFVNHRPDYRWHNGRWWYQRPDRSWRYYDNGWQTYHPRGQRHYSYRPYSYNRDYDYGYRRGYRDYDDRWNGNRRYDDYRGRYDGPYGRGNDGNNFRGNIGGFQFSF